MSHLSYCLAELTAVTDAVADLHAKAMHAWQSGAHQLGGAARVAGGALDAVELEDESSDGGGGVATALPGRRRSALSESLWQRAAAEGAAACENSPPPPRYMGGAPRVVHRPPFTRCLCDCEYVHLS